jgi:N,N'-diacetyllegionaminate synthase
VFLVAEIGVNWDGDIEIASNMMKYAKDVGFDAVKFQAYNEDIIGEHPEKNRLLKSAITKENIESISNASKSIGIEWFCTPMYVEAVDFLEPYVKRFKIRVTDGKPLLQNKTSPLLDRVFKTNKEIIVSTQFSPKDTKFEKHPGIKWLYCVPIYPCRLDEVDFRNIDEFNGYSNHCPDIAVPITSAILGAEIIEVHVTSNKINDFVDNPVSFDFKDSKKMIDLINSAKKIKK